jgi:chloramphenicol O-acetyltransferase type B
MAWWDWPDHELRAAVPLITSPDIEALHDHWRSLKVG